MKKTLITLAAFATGAVAQAADVEIPWENLTVNLANPTTNIELSGQNKDFSSSTGEYTMILIMNNQGMKNNLEEYTGDWMTVEVGAAGYGMYWDHSIRFFRGNQNGNGAYGTLWLDGGYQKDENGNVIYDDETGAPIAHAGYGNRKTDLTITAGAPFESDNTTSGTVNSVVAYDNDVVKERLAYTLTVKKSTWTEGDTEKSGVTFTLGVMEGDGTLSTASWNQEWSPTQAFDSFRIENADGMLEHMLIFNTALDNDVIEKVISVVIPEPTTATLSLLALAGLAARRRRK